jgi:hypothetical protein
MVNLGKAIPPGIKEIHSLWRAMVAVGVSSPFTLAIFNSYGGPGKVILQHVVDPDPEGSETLGRIRILYGTEINVSDPK